MKKIIFVCLGNICRSPIAEACAQKFIQEHKLPIIASSAGTGSWHVGEPPCPDSVRVAKLHGLSISSLRASQFKKNDSAKYDLVVALDAHNYSDLQALGAKNLVKLGEYGYEGEDIPDPYFFDGFEGFERVFTMIESCVNNLLMQELKT